MLESIYIIFVVVAFFLIVVVVLLRRQEKEKERRKTKQRQTTSRTSQHISITISPPLTSPSVQPVSLTEFTDRRHPTWAAAEAASAPRSPTIRSSPPRSRPSRNTARIPHRPAHEPTRDVPTVRHPSWAAAAERAEEEAAARQGLPPPFKHLDLSIPPPTYDKHTTDTRITPAT